MKKTIFIIFAIALLVLLTTYLDPANKDGRIEEIEQSPFEATSFLRTHFINAGQADASLLQIKNEDDILTVLIDTGDWNRKDVLAYLHNENIEVIDLIIITHPHADHIGQLDKIIESFTVHEVWMNGELSNSQVFVNALRAIEMYEVDYYEPTIGETFDIGPLKVEILHPADLTLGTNDNSIVLKATYGSVSMLFTGDVERAGEEKMLNRRENLSAHILHVGHHGSNTSTTGSFLEAVGPQTAIYSAGINNSYGHPNEEILERFKNRQMDVYGTDIDGTIIVETDGQTYHIITENDAGLPKPLAMKSCIDINSADIQELQKIIHIGEKSAQDIIFLRPFHSVDELIEISGIGPKKLADIIEQQAACIGG